MDSIFGLDSPANIGEGLSVLTTAFSNEELAVIRSILEGAQIPYLAKTRGAGGATNVIMGFNMYGTDIFVRDEDLEAAEALFGDFAEEGEELAEIEPEEEI